jgi:DNA-binding LytR/AlgR family response regulator
MPDYPVRILIVEDEMIIGAKIFMYLTDLGYEVAGIFAGAEETLHYLQAYQSEIALVDIELRGSMDGIELAGLLREEHQLPVIFLTGNFDDATFARAKEARPYAFLSKPMNKMELSRALELTINLISDEEKLQNAQPQNKDAIVLPDRIFIHHGAKKLKILLDTILYIQAERNYCRIITTTQEYLLSIPMKSLEDELPSGQFQRIHRSHIVNLSHIDELDEHAVYIGGKMLTLSKSYQQQFLKRIKSI